MMDDDAEAEAEAETDVVGEEAQESSWGWVVDQ